MEYKRLYEQLSGVAEGIRQGAYEPKEPDVGVRGLMKRTQRIKEGKPKDRNPVRKVAGYFAEVNNPENTMPEWQEARSELLGITGGGMSKGNIGVPVGGETLVKGLVKRGLSPEVAKAFVINFQDESGLVSDIVEHEPNVHGTRGKGLYQLTGSRRAQFEKRYGGDYSVDNQLDFLVWELNNTEKNAFEKIQQAGSTGEAAAAIVTHFLRPAEEHRQRRVRKYTGLVKPRST